MKKISITLLLLIAVAIVAMAQAQMPTIMVRPGASWCAQNGYTKTIDNQGQEKIIPLYEKALLDSKMIQAITEIEALLKDEGCKTASMQTATSSIEDFAAEELLDDDEDGNYIDKSALDISRERAMADIYLDVNWSIDKIGPKSQLSYTLQGKDYYTGDDVCSVTGIGTPSISATEAVLLREAVIGKMPELKDRLQNYFQDILTNGRGVYVAIRVSSASDLHLESSMTGGTLGRLIYKWVLKNAVEHRAEQSRSSRTSSNYTVKIPVYDVDELPMSAEDFGWQLSDYLSNLGVKTRVTNQGLGRTTITIQGSK